MTRDVAAQAVHERLEHFVTSMPEPDIEAGWAALVAQLEPPVAPVVPLRSRPRPRRALVLGVAAAILIGGSALAMVRHGGNHPDQHTPSQPGVTAPGRVGMGPHAHPALSGPLSHHQGVPVGSGANPKGGTGPAGGTTSSGGSSSGTHGNGDSHAFHHDSPSDTDHGTGNDGTNGDNGQGNNTQGQDTQGNGSTGGSGNDQGSGSGQASNRGTGGGENPTSGAGSNSGHDPESQGQGSNG